MKFRSPFQCTPKPEIVRVGNHETGFIYLLKKNGLSPCENPVDLQKASRKQAQTTGLIYQAVKAYSVRHQVSEDVARQVVLSAKPNLTYQDYLSPDSQQLHAELMKEAIRNYAERENVDKRQAKTLVYQAMTPVINSTDVNLFDYLSPEQTSQYLELASDTRELPYRVATLMIKYRVAYPVILSADAPIKSTVLPILPAAFPMLKGDRVRLGDHIYTLADTVSLDEDVISVVEPIPMAIASGEVGFWVNPKTNREVIGEPDWTEKQTFEELMEPQIQAIYKFYQSEIGELPDEEEATEDEEEATGSEGNLIASLKPSTPTQPAPSSTGSKSSGDSNTSEPATIA